MKKRSLSLILTVLMVLSLIMPCTNAFADTVDVAIPENAGLKWAKKLGTDWKNAPSAPAVADDGIIVMSGTTLFKLDPADGSVIKSAAMKSSPSYGTVPAAIVGGMIVAPLGKGTVQAFDEKTLESKWVYTDALKGQSLSPILYAGGKLYTGFWNNEDKDANFVCIDAATGKLEWSYTVMGGFYWAGAAEVGDHIVIGTDDGAKGTSGTSSLLSFKKTYVGGEKVEPVSSVSLTGMGDVRSSVTVDNGRVYFTTKGGYLCSAAVDADTGAISDLRSKAIGGQSTSTPVVYGDHVYFGAGSGMTDDGSSGSFVIADKETLEVKNRVELLGYPQCEMLLTTAYLETTGYLYFYSTYNMPPGGISLIRVKADDVSDARLSELYNAAGYGNYCISSVAADKNGNLYYKNDSGNIFCIGVKTVSDFADVSEKSYYYDAVAWGSAEGIVRGYSDTVFAPDDACTRAQIVTFLYRYAGSPAVSGECKFTDVTDENYKNAIIWASENDIALGYSDTVFAPNDTCTRAQAVTFMHRYMGTHAYDHDRSFTDITGGEYYYGAVMWAAGRDITNGFPDGSFRPNDECTRAQIVTFIYRAAA